jgi:hypothetical protein
LSQMMEIILEVKYILCVFICFVIEAQINW